MRASLGGISSRVDITEEVVNKLEDMTIEERKKNILSFSELWDNN